MSSQPIAAPIETSSTAPGPPVAARGTALAIGATHPCNPFQVDLVLPFDLSASGDRVKAQREIREGYEELLRALEGEGGLRVASRPGRGGKAKEEVWVFVGAGEDKVSELVERERYVISRDHS